MKEKSQNDLIVQESQQSPEVAGAVSLTSVLKKFITELFSGLTSSCSSSGGLFASSVSGAFSSSAAGLSSGAALSASGCGNDWESCCTLAASSYVVTKSYPLRMMLEQQSRYASSECLNRSIELGAQFQPCLCLHRPASTISLLLMCVSHPSLIDIQQCVRVMALEISEKHKYLTMSCTLIAFFHFVFILGFIKHSPICGENCVGKKNLQSL